MIQTKVARVAAVQAGAEEVADDQAFMRKIADLTRLGKETGAQILVFPEDIGLWLERGWKSPRVRYMATFARRFGATALEDGRKSIIPENVGMIERVIIWLERLFDWIVIRIRMRRVGRWLARRGIAELYRKAFAQAARDNDVVIVAGSVLERRRGGIYNSCYVFDTDGSIAGISDKHHLLAIEKSLGIKEGKEIRAVQTQGCKIGALVCYDLNFQDVSRELAEQGAQIICGGSLGYRLFPNSPYDPARDAPQIERCRETGLAFVRAYQSGWMVPGVYMDGLSDIVVPPNGTITKQSFPNRRDEQWILADDVPLR